MQSLDSSFREHIVTSSPKLLWSHPLPLILLRRTCTTLGLVDFNMGISNLFETYLNAFNGRENPEMTSTAPGTRSNDGSGSAGAQSNHRNDSVKPIDGMNMVLPSPERAHDPKTKQIKLPPGFAAATGNQHGVEKVVLNFVDGILDPNLARNREKSVRCPSALPALRGRKKWNPNQQQRETLLQITPRLPTRMGGPSLSVVIRRGLNGQNPTIPTFPRNAFLRAFFFTVRPPLGATHRPNRYCATRGSAH